jgi:hypothetical protein
MIAEEQEKARRDKIAMLHYARHEGEAIGEAKGLNAMNSWTGRRT